MNIQNMSLTVSETSQSPSRRTSASSHSQYSPYFSGASGVSSVSSFPSLSGNTSATSPRASSMSPMPPFSTSRSPEIAVGTQLKLEQQIMSTMPLASVVSGGFVPTVDDTNNAMRLMQQERQAKGKFHNKPFTLKESNPVLAKIASGEINNTHGVTPGVVEVLFKDFDARMSVMKPKSTNILKMVIGVDQSDTPYSTNLLLQAMKHCNAEIIRVLLRYADSPSRTQALPVAIQTNDPRKVEYVMASGADASPLCEQFQEVVKSGSYETLHALVSNSKTLGPCQDCLNVALIQAVHQRSLRRTLVLLNNRADTMFQGSAALFAAVKNGSADLVEAIISFMARSNQKLVVDTLSRATVSAYENIETSKYIEAQYKILFSCLAVGLDGQRASQFLISALQNGQFTLVEGFVKYKVKVYENPDVGSAIINAAVATANPGVVRAVLSIGNGPAKEQMKSGMAMALKLESFEAASAIAALLVESGLCGDHAVSEGLLSTIKRLVQCSSTPGSRKEEYTTLYTLAKLLLSRGVADVNFQGGEALVQASAYGLQDVLGLLLRYKPSTAWVTKAILPAMRLEDSIRRYELVKMLLNSGAQGSPVGEALILSAGMGKDHIGLTTLLLPHSSGNFQDGKPLKSAVKSGCLDQIKLIIESGALTSPTIGSAWIEVKTVADETFQMAVYKLFFKHGGKIDCSLCDSALVGAASLGHRGRSLCELMLQHGGSPERLNGQAIAAAAKSLDLDTLQLFSSYVRSPVVYTNAFATLTQNSNWLVAEGFKIAIFLLERGASGAAVDAAFRQAASHHHLDAVQLLRAHVGPDMLGQALISAANDPTKWCSPRDTVLDLITELLEAGASSEYANHVLLCIIEGVQNAEDIIETLLTVGDGHANVNYEDGEALKMVIRQGSPRLLDSMLEWARQMGCSATQKTMTHAFAETITTGRLDDEKVILKIIDVLVKPRNNTPLPDLNALMPQYQSWAPMIACIQRHPNLPQLVKQLANLGCDLKVETMSDLYDDEEVQAEPANLLAWALCLTDENQIASATIGVLIDAGVDINFTSKVSAATPLILAAKYDRGDIVSKLIDKKASISARDCFDRSSLFYASRIGNVEAVKALVKAKSRVNDGSLQEAARNLHFETVLLLLKAGHHTNYPSSHSCHDGRDALQELALRAQPTRTQAPVLEDTIRALAGSKEKSDKEKGDKVKVMQDTGALDEKNALFLALDNPSDGCWIVCRALLEVFMWKIVNDPTNVWAVQDPSMGSRLFLSPTMYVRLGYFQGPEQQKDALLQLLARIKCQDRFYAELGKVQPLNAAGLPDEIAKAEAKRRAKEEKHREEEEENLRKDIRKEYEEQVRRMTDQMRHDEKMLHQREIEEQKRYQADLSHYQHQLHAADNHDRKLQLQTQMAQSQQYWAVEKAKFEETKKQRMMALNEHKMNREQQLKIDFEQRRTAQKLAGQQQQNLLAQQEAKRKMQAQKNMQALKAKGEKQKLEFKKKQNAQAKKMLTAQTAHKRIGHRLQMEKAHEDQQTLKMKAAMKYFDTKHPKRIGS